MKSLKVLVIDDERVICDACRIVLSEKGYSVELRNTGEAGLRAIREGGYDVVLLDMKLPDIDGIDILRAVREEQLGPCVIVMTGYATMNNAVQAMKTGAVDYLAKPFTEDELMEALERSCSGASRK